jgi:ATPases involved in chromosome partitioning
MARVVSFVSASGGVGKTTFSVLTAGALAIHGKRVLLLDLDPSASASLWLGVATSRQCDIKDLVKGLVDFMLGRVRSRPDVGKCIERHRVNGTIVAFDVVPGGNLDDIAGEIRSVPRWDLLLVKLLEPVLEQYDYVVVDSPNWVYPFFPMTVPLSSYYVVLSRPDAAEIEKTKVFVERVVALMRNQFEISSPDMYIVVVLNQMRYNQFEQIEEAWRRASEALKGSFPNIVVAKCEEKYRYYGSKESEFYGFKLRTDLGIEAYRERGHILVRREDEVRKQFEAFYKFLIKHIEATSPYRLE